ncbi:MAG TPA: hypothetical protein VMI47_08440 [Pseudolabrys sp.]|nr:hypothetical protein [Pseudolabrys sp.]
MALTRAQLADPDCPVSDDDYDAIESAIMETARGRWFLFEYARRHRHADTMMVMSAIGSLHDSLQATLQEIGPPERGPEALSDLRDASAAESAGAAAPTQGSAPETLPDAPLQSALAEALDALPAASPEAEPVVGSLPDRAADAADAPARPVESPDGWLPDRPAAKADLVLGTMSGPLRGAGAAPAMPVAYVSTRVSGSWLTQQRARASYEMRTLEQAVPAVAGAPTAPAEAAALAGADADVFTFK